MPHLLPDLPYPANALEPHIDEQTMLIHHDKHHAAYTTKLNAALEGTEFSDFTACELLGKLDDIPEAIRGAVRNNGGGHYNHSLFWTIMGPDKGGHGPLLWGQQHYEEEHQLLVASKQTNVSSDDSAVPVGIVIAAVPVQSVTKGQQIQT